jgi:ribosomal protein S18 acetylase RimI-like enzyme
MGTLNAASISRVRGRERTRAFDTLVAAFADDRVERWLYPEWQQYLARFPEFLAAFGGRAFDAGTVWKVGDFSAVALWLPPGAEPDGEEIVRVLTASVSQAQHADMFAVLDQMTAAHPRFPHWYLPWLAVDPAQQGGGIGSQLLAHGLEIVDSSHLPAYLETPNPRSIAFYERHGFRVTGSAQAGACPPLALMLRAAR